jgi:hypothetical protein
VGVDIFDAEEEKEVHPVVEVLVGNSEGAGKWDCEGRKFFFPSHAKFRPAATHAPTQPTKEVGGRSLLGPADAVGTIRLMPFLPDDAPSPSHRGDMLLKFPVQLLEGERVQTVLHKLPADHLPACPT